MKFRIFALLLILNITLPKISIGQCADSISINSISAECNGNGTSTVTINVTVLFGNGNNSAVISYNIGAGEVTAFNLEDDNGDIIDQTYTFDVPTCNPYTVTLTAWTNPAGSGSSCTDPAPDTENIVVPPLPVEFGELHVNTLEVGMDISWLTFTEVNNQYFEIERSDDGIHFRSIGTIDAGVNSTSIKEYSYYDKSPFLGINYYRIKQIDIDGNHSYSGIEASVYSSRCDIEIYPNPASEYLTITSDLNSFNILNSNGIIVKEVIKSGLTEVIDITQLATGLYSIQDLEGRLQSRIIITK
jgi:hypothetical protein